jgi:hypothetical protein
LGWHPGPTGQSPRVGLTELARPSRPFPLTHSPLGRTLTLIPLWRSESPTSSSPDSGELRRDPPLPNGASALPRHALPPNCVVSSPPPPIAAIVVELRPSRSCPCGLIYSGELCWNSCPRFPVLAVSSSSLHRLDGCYNPDVAALLFLAARSWARCRLLTGAAPGRWPCCHNRGCAIVLPPWSSTLLLWEHSCEFLLLLLASMLLLWWPGQRARHACLCCWCAMLLLLLCSSLCYCCCCSAWACVASLCTLLLWILVQVLVQDSVKNFLTKLGMII